jgi:hypothetical protein
MNDTQILTAALAIIIPVSMLIFSNSRIDDAKETLRAEMKALHAELLGELRELKSLLKAHELEHHR